MSKPRPPSFLVVVGTFTFVGPFVAGLVLEVIARLSSLANPAGAFAVNPVSPDIRGGLGLAFFWFAGLSYPPAWKYTILPTVSAAVLFHLVSVFVASRYPLLLCRRLAAIATSMFVGGLSSIFVWEVLALALGTISIPSSNIYLPLSLVVPTGILLGAGLGALVRVQTGAASDAMLP